MTAAMDLPATRPERGHPSRTVRAGGRHPRAGRAPHRASDPSCSLHLRPFLADARAGVAYDEHFWHPYVVVGAAAPRRAVGAGAVGGRPRRGADDPRRPHPPRHHGDLPGGRRQPPAQRDPLPPQPDVPRDPPRRVGPPADAVDPLVRRVVAAPPRAAGAPAGGALWPLVLLRVQVSLVYFASGFSKLVDPDWLGGLVLWDRVVRYQHVLDPAPGWVGSTSSRGARSTTSWPRRRSPPSCSSAAGLWFPRTRLVAIRVAIVFHLAIELGARVEVFSFAAIAALAIWVTPTPRDRSSASAARDALRPDAGTWCPPWTGSSGSGRGRPAGGSRVVMVDRDGTTLHGRAAVRAHPRATAG